MSHKAGQLFIKIICLSLGFDLFCSSALGALAESNIWEERRRAAGTLARTVQGTSPLVRQPITPAIPTAISSILKPLPSFNIPANLGTPRQNLSLISSHSKGKVFVIEDVHSNAEAQRNIGKILEQLIEQELVGVVALEGTSEPISVETYQKFDDRNVITQISDYLLEKNYISGPIYAALNSKKSFPEIVGVEEENLYQSNLNAYKQAAPQLSQQRKIIEHEKKAIKEKKHQILNPSLAALDRAVEAYREGSITLGEYAATLNSKTLSITASVRNFLEARRREQKLDQERIEEDRNQLISQLFKKVDSKKQKLLLDKSLEYRIGRIRHNDFYAFFLSFCEEAQINLNFFPHIKNYFDYLALSDRINTDILFHDLSVLEKRSYDELIKSSRERLLVDESRELYLREKMLGFVLTNEEWQEIRKIKSAPLLPSCFTEFYEHAESRNKRLIENLFKALQRRKASSAVLVVGGFHTRGVSQEIEAAGFQPILIRPALTEINLEKESSHLTLLAQEKTPLEMLFEGKKVFLAKNPASHFVLNVLGPTLATAALSRKRDPNTQRAFEKLSRPNNLSVVSPFLSVRDWVLLRLNYQGIAAVRFDPKGKILDFKSSVLPFFKFPSIETAVFWSIPFAFVTGINETLFVPFTFSIVFVFLHRLTHKEESWKTTVLRAPPTMILYFVFFLSFFGFFSPLINLGSSHSLDAFLITTFFHSIYNFIALIQNWPTLSIPSPSNPVDIPAHWKPEWPVPTQTDLENIDRFLKRFLNGRSLLTEIKTKKKGSPGNYFPIQVEGPRDLAFILRIINFKYPDVAAFLLVSFDLHSPWGDLFNSFENDQPIVEPDMLAAIVNRGLDLLTKNSFISFNYPTTNSFEIDHTLKGIGGLPYYLQEEYGKAFLRGIDPKHRKAVIDAISENLTRSLYAAKLEKVEKMLANLPEYKLTQISELASFPPNVKEPTSGNPGFAIGYLRIVREPFPEINTLRKFLPIDIPALRGLPTSLPFGPCAGLITSEEPTVSGHSQARARAWETPHVILPNFDSIAAWNNQLIALVVEGDQVSVRLATIEETQTFKTTSQTKKIIELPPIREIPDRIIPPNDPRMSDPAVVGYKVALLSQWSKKGVRLSTPRVKTKFAQGHAVPLGAFRTIMRQDVPDHREGDLNRVLTSLADRPRENQISTFLTGIRARIERQKSVAQKFWDEFVKLGGDHVMSGGVFLRGLSNVDSLPEYPGVGAGMVSTIPHVINEEGFRTGILKVISSLWASPAYWERRMFGIDETKVAPGVWIVPTELADYAGVVQTSNVAINNPFQIVVELSQGYVPGESARPEESQKGVPTQIIFDKKTNQLVGTPRQTTMQNQLILDAQGGVVSKPTNAAKEFLNLSEPDRNDILMALNEISLQAEEFFGDPQEIEFVIKQQEPQDGESRWLITILQIRSIKYSGVISNANASSPSLVQFSAGTHKFPIVQEDGVVKSDYYGDFLILEMENIIKSLKRRGKAVKKVFELATGRGSITTAIGLLTDPEVQIVTMDANEKAVHLARRNFELNGLQNRIQVKHAHAEQEWEPEGPVDLMISDLPFIPVDPIAYKSSLGTPQFREIDGGPDGRKYLDMIINRANQHMRLGGSLVLVQPDFIGIEKTFELMRRNGFEPRIVAQTSKNLEETVFTMKNRAYIEKTNAYKFKENANEKPFFNIVIIEGVKILETTSLGIQDSDNGNIYTAQPGLAYSAPSLKRRIAAIALSVVVFAVYLPLTFLATEFMAPWIAHNSLLKIPLVIFQDVVAVLASTLIVQIWVRRDIKSYLSSVGRWLLLSLFFPLVYYFFANDWLMPHLGKVLYMPPFVQAVFLQFVLDPLFFGVASFYMAARVVWKKTNEEIIEASKKSILYTMGPDVFIWTTAYLFSLKYISDDPAWSFLWLGLAEFVWTLYLTAVYQGIPFQWKIPHSFIKKGGMDRLIGRYRKLFEWFYGQRWFGVYLLSTVYFSYVFVALQLVNEVFPSGKVTALLAAGSILGWLLWYKTKGYRYVSKKETKPSHSVSAVLAGSPLEVGVETLNTGIPLKWQVWKSAKQNMLWPLVEESIFFAIALMLINQIGMAGLVVSRLLFIVLHLNGPPFSVKRTAHVLTVPLLVSTLPLLLLHFSLSFTLPAWIDVGLSPDESRIFVMYLLIHSGLNFLTDLVNSLIRRMGGKYQFGKANLRKETRRTIGKQTISQIKMFISTIKLSPNLTFQFSKELAHTIGKTLKDGGHKDIVSDTAYDIDSDLIAVQFNDETYLVIDLKLDEDIEIVGQAKTTEEFDKSVQLIIDFLQNKASQAILLSESPEIKNPPSAGGTYRVNITQPVPLKKPSSPPIPAPASDELSRSLKVVNVAVSGNLKVTGAEYLELEKGATVERIVQSPDNRWLAVSTRKHTGMTYLWLIDILRNNGVRRFQFKSHEGTTFSPNNNDLAVIVDQRARLINLTTGQFTDMKGEKTLARQNLMFVWKGKGILGTLTNGGVGIWRSSGELAQRWEIHKKTISSVSLDPIISMLLVEGLSDGTIFIKDHRKNESAQALPKFHENEIASVIFNEAGDTLVSQDGTGVVFWDLKRFVESTPSKSNFKKISPLKKFDFKENPITTFTMSFNTLTFFTGHKDGTILATSIESGQTQVVGKQNDRINTLALNTAGNILLSGGLNNSVMQWPLPNVDGSYASNLPVISLEKILAGSVQTVDIGITKKSVSNRPPTTRNPPSIVPAKSGSLNGAPPKQESQGSTSSAPVARPRSVFPASKSVPPALVPSEPAIPVQPEKLVLKASDPASLLSFKDSELVLSMTRSSDQKWAAVITQDNKNDNEENLYIVLLETGQKIHIRSTAKQEPFGSVTFSPDGVDLFFFEGDSLNKTGLKKIKRNIGKNETFQLIDEEILFSIELTQGKRTLAVLPEPKIIVGINNETGKGCLVKDKAQGSMSESEGVGFTEETEEDEYAEIIQTYSKDSRFQTVVGHPSRQMFIYIGADKSVYLRKREKWDPIFLGPLPNNEGERNLFLDFAGQRDRVIAISNINTVSIWNFDGAVEAIKFSILGSPITSAVIYDDDHVIVGHQDGQISLIDLMEKRSEKIAQQKSTVTSLVLTNENKTLLAGGKTGSLQKWSLETQGDPSRGLSTKTPETVKVNSPIWAGLISLAVTFVALGNTNSTIVGSLVASSLAIIFGSVIKINSRSMIALITRFTSNIKLRRSQADYKTLLLPVRSLSESNLEMVNSLKRRLLLNQNLLLVVPHQEQENLQKIFSQDDRIAIIGFEGSLFPTFDRLSVNQLDTLIWNESPTTQGSPIVVIVPPGVYLDESFPFGGLSRSHFLWSTLEAWLNGLLPAPTFNLWNLLQAARETLLAA